MAHNRNQMHSLVLKKRIGYFPAYAQRRLILAIWQLASGNAERAEEVWKQKMDGGNVVRATTKNWNKCFIVTVRNCYIVVVLLFHEVVLCAFIPYHFKSVSQKYLINDGIEEAWFAFNYCYNTRK